MCHVTEQPLHDGTSLHMPTCHVLGTIVILIFCVAARKRPIAFLAPHYIVHHTSAPGIVNMMRKAGLVLLIAAALTFSAEVLAASAPAPAPALTATVSTVATSVNTTGSLGVLKPNRIAKPSSRGDSKFIFTGVFRQLSQLKYHYSYQSEQR